ncbi:unnamed protein product [Urochloa humidicola]
MELAVGPGCSRLVQASSVFVQGIKVSLEADSQGNDGLVLYGLAGAPPLDVPAEWSQAPASSCLRAYCAGYGGYCPCLVPVPKVVVPFM